MTLTYAEILDAFRYDPATGVFTWKRARSNVKAGDVAGTIKADGYRQLCIGGLLMLAHRVAWLYAHGEWPKHDIDHINGDITDNRIANLRDVPRLLNMQNQRRAQVGNKSGFLGVYLDKRRGKYIARLRVPGGGNMRHVGQFDTPEEAHAAYLAAKREHHEGCTI